MILGPNLIYQCPSCDTLFETSSMISGNTFGAKRYSDGKVEARMMNNPLQLYKCHGCHQFLWLSKLSSIGEYELDEGKPEIWKSAEYPDSLSIDEFLEFLSTSFFNRDEELYVRLRVLWGFNDRVRMGLPQFISSNDQENWTSNIVQLLDVLDWGITENRLLAGELLRYLKDFDYATEILSSIKEKNLNSYRVKIQEKCEQRNFLVFQF